MHQIYLSNECTLLYVGESMKNEMLIVVVVSIFIITAFAVVETANINNKDHQHMSALYPKANHDVIRINGDGDFDSNHGVVSGDGSVTSPYKISGWVINGGGKGIAIYIGNTTKNFTIENCELFNANGGNFDTYHQNAGITIYNAKATDIYIQTNSIHDNSGAGIVITHTTTTEKLHIGVYGVGSSINRIYNNGRAGVYSSSTNNIEVTYNNIWNNSYGVQFGSVTNFDITWNGIGENTNYGIYINGAQNGNIYSNVIYDNNGATGHYDSSHVQAYQSGSSGITWYDASTNNGNFWYDWAMNNNTNYDMVHNNFVIPWPYKFTGAQDPYPMKGVHHGAIYMTQNGGVPDENHTFNIATGVVEGDGKYYRILGWEIGGSTSGYGILINTLLRYSDIYISSVIAHNITTQSGATEWLYMGNGIAINGTVSTVYIYNTTVYGCEHNGLGFSNLEYPLRAYNNWIYKNDVGIYITGSYSPHLFIDDSTIESNTHWGVYVDATNTEATSSQIIVSFHNMVIEKNEVGIITANNLNALSIDIEYSSFFENTGYGVKFNKNTNSSIYMENNIFYHNNGAGDTYDPSHIQAYADDNSNFTDSYGNYYHDWVNDKTVSGDQYPLGGGNIKDVALTHIDFHGFNYPYTSSSAAMYVDSTNIDTLRYTGTRYGITGYDGTYYYIVGWHNTENYTDNLGIDYGLYITGDKSKSFIVSNVLIDNSGYGISVSGANLIEVKNSVIKDNKYTGIWEGYNRINGIDYNRVYNNYVGIEVEGASYYTLVYENRVYRNTAQGVYLEAVSASSAFFKVNVFHNYVFGNDVGLYGSSIADTFINNNGFAWNTHYGVELHSSNSNYISNNTFYENNASHDSYSPYLIQAYDNGNNYWNDSNYGNYWFDWANNNDSNDANYDWIVDYPYHVYGGNSEDSHPYLYRDHEVTRIESSDDLNWNHGFVAGDGSSEYPYLMTGFMYNGNGHDYGIYVGNLSGNIYLRLDHVIVASVSSGNMNNVYHSGSGIIVYNFTGMDFQIYGSSSGYNYYDGLDIGNSYDITIRDSYFDGNNYDGIYIYSNSYYVTITNTVLSGNQHHGILAFNSQQIYISYSNISENQGDGIYFYYVTHGGITNSNNISKNTNYGVYLSHSSDIDVYGNIFYENHGASGDGTYDSNHIQAYDDENTEYTNFWNDTSQGNCWSDWNQGTPYQLDPGPNYVAKDHKPGCQSVPELNTLIVAILLVIAMGIAVRRRKN